MNEQEDVYKIKYAIRQINSTILCVIFWGFFTVHGVFFKAAVSIVWFWS